MQLNGLCNILFRKNAMMELQIELYWFIIIHVNRYVVIFPYYNSGFLIFQSNRLIIVQR